MDHNRLDVFRVEMLHSIKIRLQSKIFEVNKGIECSKISTLAFLGLNHFRKQVELAKFLEEELAVIEDGGFIAWIDHIYERDIKSDG